MIVFPNAKINIGLWVTGKRADGYHNLESLFYPVDFFDLLEAIHAPDDKFSFSMSGMAVPGNTDDNLVVKAYHIINQRYNLKPVHVHLHKVIPPGSGLGGGSSDGAFMLKLLNSIFKLELSADELRELAASLGSDCPFFIANRPALVSGRGDVVKEYPLSLKGYYLLLVFPGVHISTSEAYAGISAEPRKISLENLLSKPPEAWRNALVNDFEKVVFHQFPELAQIMENMYEKGAVYASMTGSGSAIYGIFRSKPENNLLKFARFEVL